VLVITHTHRTRPIPRNLLDHHTDAAGIDPLDIEDGELVLKPEQH
jgi:hypothetical protein